MTMRQRAQDLKVPAIGCQQRLASEQATSNDVDEVGRQVGQVPEGLMFDLPAVSVGTPQEVRLVGLALVVPGCGGYVNRSISPWHGLQSIEKLGTFKRNL
jgi:hypothetical protein